VTDRGELRFAAGAGLFGAEDLTAFRAGTHGRLYEKLGARPARRGDRAGTHFAVWAPHAAEVSVLGDWNRWRPGADLLEPWEDSGIWQGFLPGVSERECYKYHLRSRVGGHAADKADPFAFAGQCPPETASVVARPWFPFHDGAWLQQRSERQGPERPMTFYEVHLGSWRRVLEEGDRTLTYRELAITLGDYVEELGFTHVELLPVLEHPFYGSWGYLPTGYFAPTARYGEPADLAYLIDELHRRGLGVFLDWVPSHFPGDGHGLAFYDGTHLYEPADPRRGFHPDWNSWIFDYGRGEVRSFLLSSACFWLDRYHVDGLRVDAVASMLYLDYSRPPGEWLPNDDGGRENWAAVEFLRRLNQEVYARFPGAQMVAEESTTWPLVSRPAYDGGLGFGFKWDMGWMHDTLEYLARDPLHRSHHHQALTFRRTYAYSENFVLALSHDEVVHGKGSLLAKMPGDPWQQRANLRLLLAYQAALPGKKLLFMGCEWGQEREWDHDRSLDWHLLEREEHRGIKRLAGHLNRLVRGEPALFELDCDEAGFEWIEPDDREASVLSFLRRGRRHGSVLLVVLNFTPVVRYPYRLGVPWGGRWVEVLNSDGAEYGGSGQGNLGGVVAEPEPWHGREWSLPLRLPPLAALFLRREAPGEAP
jgi:1,4-alpha-glucan branching enzyme